MRRRQDSPLARPAQMAQSETSAGPRNSRQGGALGMTVCIAAGLGTQRKQYNQATSRKDAERTFRERKGNILSQLYFSVGTQLIVARQP
jgi:hypothetical protein